jgi:hypothetical protein
VLFYRAALPLSSRTLNYAAGIIRGHLRTIGSRWRKLSPGQQALLVLAYLRKEEANRAHAKLRAPGERANAQLKAWKILAGLRCCPGAPENSRKPFTYCSSAKHKQVGISSLTRTVFPF